MPRMKKTKPHGSPGAMLMSYKMTKNSTKNLSNFNSIVKFNRFGELAPLFSPVLVSGVFQ